MNERVQILRQKSLDAVPAMSMERAQIVTDVYRKYSGTVSIPVLRAMAFKALMENKSICINEGELIVGERGPLPKLTPTYPELCCHTIEDFEVIDKREKVFFKVDELAKQIQDKEIIPFWKGRSMRDLIISNMSEEWKDCYEAGIFTEFMEQRAPGHTVADNKIFNKGFKEFKNDIEKQLASLDFTNDMEAYDKQEELKAMKICADAIIRFAERHAEKALELAEKESDPQRKAELQQISKVCYHVPANAPENFWEALQAYWFVHLGVITELNTWDSYCPGRLDQKGSTQED
jgi:pyruvate-formate lyase